MKSLLRRAMLDSETFVIEMEYVDSKGKRIYMEDSLEDGETIAFMVGIAGG